jgi:GntR family transcriptional regulator
MPLSRFSPLYRWLSDTLRNQITQGIYKPGDALPTEFELMRRYHLSSTTVKRAVHDLVREGWIYRKAGKGTFVKRDKVTEHLLRLTSFAEEMQSRHITPNFKLIVAKMIAAPAEVSQAFKTPASQPVCLIELIQLANREPMALARGYWSHDIGEPLLQKDLHRIPLYEVVEHELHIPLLEADESISAATADADIAKKLDIPRHSPLLVRRRLTYTTEMRPVEYTVTFYRADRYEYKVRLERHTI